MEQTPGDRLPRLTAVPRDRHSAAKQVLVFGCRTEALEALLAEISALPHCSAGAGQSEAAPTVQIRELRLAWHTACSIEAVLRQLEEDFVNLLVLDLRGPASEFAQRRQRAMALVNGLDAVEDAEARYGFHRILVLLSGHGQSIDEAILEFGQRGIGLVLREPEPVSVFPPSPSAPPTSLASSLADLIYAALTRPRRDRRALCAAGGGITGIYFEMGALKCLDDCFGGRLVNHFDMYFGISAGAVVASIMANGYSIDEMMAAVAGHEGGRLSPLTMALFRFGHLDYPSLLRRLRRAMTAGWLGAVGALRRTERFALEGVLFDTLDLLGPPFRGHAFERMIRRVLTVPGATNDFRLLKRRLFIGATDQDARRHVLFGGPGQDRVPISVAVQASMSLNPAFSPTELDGRFLEDGAVTRTSNFIEAIQRGAGLVFVLDPFVPYISREAGFARDRGALYNLDQNIRTLSFTRYESTRNWAIRRHPDVNFYTFLPANRLRRLLSVSPMDHRPYLEVWRGAYLSTLYQVRRVAHRLRGDAPFYGLDLDMSLANAVAERLRTIEVGSLQLADFYPDRRVRIPQPPLCLDGPPGPLGERGPQSAARPGSAKTREAVPA